MRTAILLPAILFQLASIATAQPKETEAESKISAVTVFFSGAQITRKATVQLQPGTNMIRFSQLSYHIDPNSIQVEGNSKFTIVAVNHRINHLKDIAELPQVKPLKEKIDKLQEEMEAVKIESLTLQEEKQMIDANKQFTGTSKTFTVDDMMDMSELYQKRYLEILQEMVVLQKKETTLQAEIRRYKKQMQEEAGGMSTSSSEIVLNLSSPARSSAEITFKYITRNAGWSPSYDAKATDVKDKLSLTYKAKVVQSTGEEWKNVKLTLSTGNPNRNQNRPDLAVWQLRGYDQEEAERRRKAEEDRYKNAQKKSARSEGAPSMAPEMAVESAKLEDKEETVRADRTRSTATLTTVEQGSVSVEYSIAIPYTIASDGKDYTVEIARHELNANYRYYAVPKYDKSAFLVGYISGWEKFNLMSGMASVYLGDNYIGQSLLNTVSTLDSIELSLGRDKSVLVERKKIKDFAKPSVAASTRKVTLGIELVVKNTRNTGIKLDLEDQYPVTRNKEIEVELLEAEGATVKKETGTLLWALELKAGETRTIRFVYTVKYPKDKDISNF